MAITRRWLNRCRFKCIRFQWCQWCDVWILELKMQEPLNRVELPFSSYFISHNARRGWRHKSQTEIWLGIGIHQMELFPCRLWTGTRIYNYRPIRIHTHTHTHAQSFNGFPGLYIFYSFELFIIGLQVLYLLGVELYIIIPLPRDAPTITKMSHNIVTGDDDILKLYSAHTSMCSI